VVEEGSAERLEASVGLEVGETSHRRGTSRNSIYYSRYKPRKKSQNREKDRKDSRQRQRKKGTRKYPARNQFSRNLTEHILDEPEKKGLK